MVLRRQTSSLAINRTSRPAICSHHVRVVGGERNKSPSKPESCESSEWCLLFSKIGASILLEVVPSSFLKQKSKSFTGKRHPSERCASFPCLSQKVQRTKKVLLLRKAVTVHPCPSSIFAFKVLVLKHNDTHTHTRTYKQDNLAKLIYFFSTKLQVETFVHFPEMNKKLLAHRNCSVLFGTCSLFL